ncbi:hypothetical protein KIN20_026847 [Parelaphostrongylus tenuis]|uniref:Uncharacterized protein n=1 Tax=Parelaphostrongylus tenuis TaxID=148309 RepID=A0AAD5QYJ6_PARTN|nr:hypothetical protein KIN20_026847 [Parelaphostrongylus tenuis]
MKKLAEKELERPREGSALDAAVLRRTRTKRLPKSQGQSSDQNCNGPPHTHYITKKLK